MADNGSSSGNGLAFLTKKVGPFPVWLWALAAAGLYYWYTHYGPGKAATTSPTTSSTTSTTTTSEPVEPVDVTVEDDDDDKKHHKTTPPKHGEPPISRQHRSKKVRHLEHDIHKDYEGSQKNKRKDHTPARKTHPVPPRRPRPVHRRPADQAAASRTGHQEAA